MVYLYLNRMTANKMDNHDFEVINLKINII